MFVVKRKGRRVGGCTVFLNKPVSRLRDLEDLLDDLTTENILRLPPETLRSAKPGERGWVLRPGPEWAVYVPGAGDTSALVMSRLDQDRAAAGLCI